jgi:hypothetical protein
MKRYITLFILVFVLIGCTDNPSVPIKPEPSYQAWWLRISFTPNSKYIQGIPVNEIDPTWKKAYEFNKNDIPSKYLNEFDEDSMTVNNVAFSLQGDFNNDKIKDLAVTGVFLDKENKKGTFLIVFTEEKENILRVTHLQKWFYNTEFAVVDTRSKDGIGVWFCMYCNNGIFYRWEQSKNLYIKEEQEDDYL